MSTATASTAELSNISQFPAQRGRAVAVIGRTFAFPTQVIVVMVHVLDVLKLVGLAAHEFETCQGEGDVSLDHQQAYG